MKCQEIQYELPLFSDDSLSVEDRRAMDEHLEHCPLCRQRLSEYQDIRNELRVLPRPEPAAGLAQMLSNAVRSRLESHVNSPSFRLIENRRGWFETWMMPSTVGAFASLIVGISLLWLMMSPINRPELSLNGRRGSENGPTVLLAANNLETDLGYLDLTPADFANSRLAFASDSPSVNPRGALIALTRSLVRGEMKDDEVVVVADVFGNGLAQISEVIEPSHDRNAVADLQRALQSDPAFAPFVPAALDKRSDSVRVVLKIQSVNVSTTYDEPSR